MTLRNKIGVIVLSFVIGLWIQLIYVNPNFSLRMDLSVFSIPNRAVTESQHTIAYGVDAQHTERVYLAVQAYLGAMNINDKVKIFIAKPKYANGAIGILNKKTYYIGIYRQSSTFRPDVIVYNGQDLVLIHELAHFFYTHMNAEDRTEDFAYLVERSMTLYKIDQAMRDK